jgi:hypothetical protein
LLLIQTGYAQDKPDIFGKLAGNENITQVTVTKSMLNMVPNIDSSLGVNGINIKNVFAKLEQVDIFTSEEESTKKKMSKEVTEFFNGNKAYEVLLKIKNEDENVVFYGEKDDKNFTSFVMFVDNDECVLIRLQGKFTPEDIQGIAKKVTEK